MKNLIIGTLLSAMLPALLLVAAITHVHTAVAEEVGTMGLGSITIQGTANPGINEEVVTVESTDPSEYLRVRLEWDSTRDMNLRIYDAFEGSYGADDTNPANGEFIAVPPGSPSPFRIEIVNEQGGPKDYTLTISTGATPQ